MEAQNCRSVGFVDDRCNFAAIVKGLDITPEFVDRHKNVIMERFVGALLCVWRKLKAEPGGDFSNSHIFAINQCLGLASSVALLGSDSGLLRVMMDRLASLARKSATDVSTLISVAVLAHLFTVVEKEKWLPEKTMAAKLNRARPKDTPVGFSIVDELRQRFKNANWLIGPEAVSAMGLDR